MTRPFSWSRLRDSLRDAAAPAKRAWANIVWIVGVLGLGAVGQKELLPESTLGRVLLILLFALVFTGTVLTGYRLRTRIEELETAIPAADRERIEQLKVVAGIATDAFGELPLLRQPPDTLAILYDFRRTYSGLRHYRAIYRGAVKLDEYLRFRATQGHSTVADHIQIAVEAATAYDDLIAACDGVLRATGGSAPPQPGS